MGNGINDKYCIICKNEITATCPEYLEHCHICADRQIRIELYLNNKKKIAGKV